MGIQMDLGKISIDLIDRIQKIKNLEKNSESIALLTLLECRVNLELIESIKISTNNSVLNDDADILEVIDKINISYLELLILSTKENRFFFKITKNQLKKYSVTSEKINKLLVNETAFQLICNLYVKINALKELISIKPEGKALKQLRFKTRLNNIKYRLVALIINLQESKLREIFLGGKKNDIL